MDQNDAQAKYANLCAQLGDLQFKKRALSVQVAAYDAQIQSLNSQLDTFLASLRQAAEKPVETTAE